MEANYNVVGVIPARYESKRLEHKLTKKLSGKTLLQWSWENASSAHCLDRLIIACDHEELRREAEKFGAEVVLTSVDHSSGTDRIAEAVADIDAKVIINIQADEPLINPSIIDRLAQEILNDEDLVMATAKKKIEDENETKNPNVVKVITDRSDFAIYFSRHALPFYRSRSFNKSYYKHLGIYAYTKDFLYTFKNLPESYLELAEKLEQLRVIEAGYKIKVIETQFDSWGVDTEEDLAKVEEILAKKNES